MNKVVIVTGGTSGIGLAAVNALKAKGCTVYALSRHGDIPCDVSDEASARAAVQQVLDKEGRIDVLVNCAGFGISGAAELTPLGTAKKQLDVNLFGTANMVNAVIPAMRRQGGGRIVNTGSVAGFVPIFTYQAERTLVVAEKLYENGVYVNTVLPPAAPADGYMLRTSLMATHTDALLDEAADVLQKVLEENHE